MNSKEILTQENFNAITANASRIGAIIKLLGGVNQSKCGQQLIQLLSRSVSYIPPYSLKEECFLFLWQNPEVCNDEKLKQLPEGLRIFLKP